MLLLRRDDIEKRVEGDGIEFYEKGNGKLIVRVPHVYSERDLIAAIHSSAYLEGMEHGRTTLQEEIREKLGLP